MTSDLNSERPIGVATSAETYRDHTLIAFETASAATEVRVYDAFGAYTFSTDSFAVARAAIDTWLNGPTDWEE